MLLVSIRNQQLLSKRSKKNPWLKCWRSPGLRWKAMTFKIDMSSTSGIGSECGACWWESVWKKKKRIGSNHQCPSWITDPKSMKLQHVATNPCPPLFPTPNPWLRKVRWNFHSGWDDQLGVFSLFRQICRGVSVWPETSLALQAAWPTCFFYIAASTRLNPFKSIQFLPFFRTNRSTLQLYVVAGCCRWWRKTFYRIHPNTMELSTFPHGNMDRKWFAVHTSVPSML